MPAPDYPYVTIPAGDYDPDSPVTAALFTAMIQNSIHNYQWIGASYTPAKDHDHDGVNSALIRLSGGHNQITDSAPTTEGNNNTDKWNKSGVSVSDGLHFDANGDYANIICPWAENDADAEASIGNGANFMMAILASCATIGSGKLAFGLSDGNGSSFAAGCKAEILSSDWSGAHIIAWTKLLNKGSGFAEPRMTIACTATPGAVIKVRNIWCYMQCTQYAPWQPYFNLSRQHDGEEYHRNASPVWDATLNDNARYLAPV